MRFYDVIKRYMRSPRKLILTLGMKNCLNWIPDAIYLRLVYWGETGSKLCLKAPKKYNEKLQWLKLYGRELISSNYVDKYEVRSFVKDTIGEQYLIPLIGAYDSVNKIQWESLPNQFVIKCTHGSSCNIICNDKTKLDISEAKKKLNKWMNHNWYWLGREWVYKDIKPRIICEKYLVDESGTELKDYKIFCFDGEPKLIQVDFNRFTDHKRNLYTTDWKFIDASIEYPNQASIMIQKPKMLDTMLECAKKLSKGIPHVRVDLYSIRDEIYFGELTFYHGSGLEHFSPESFNELLGSWLQLPE